MKSFKNTRANRGCGRLLGRCADCKDWEPIPFHDDGGVCLAAREAPASWCSTMGLPNLGAPSAPAAVALVRVRD